MRKLIALLLVILVGLQPASVLAKDEGSSDNSKELSSVMTATLMAAQGKPDVALKMVEPIIAAHDKIIADEKRQVYGARTQTETLVYLMMPGPNKEGVIVMGPSWGAALYIKGYALIDLQRGDEARIFLERAVAMSPYNAQFIAELAEWHKARHEWEEALALFQRAQEASEVSPDNSKVGEKGRAMRGIGFVQIEQGKLSEAESTFNKCLELDPGDERAKGELSYIVQQRAKQVH